jgi:uncharacterized protein YyaL (SSP411 family)
MDWLPLDAAFADGRPVLLFVHAFYDHASHVLDAEVFEDLKLPSYACARVDVDQHPEVAARLEPGLPRILIVSRERKLLADHVRPTRNTFSRLLDNPTREVRAAAPQKLADWEELADFRLGGFGRPPKIPHAEILGQLLEHPELPWARPFVERTLNAIVQGGLHDHLGGGFHRASADDAWVVPQFGKRAVDQAALIPLLMRAAERFQKSHFAEAALRAKDWCLEFLAAPGGGYYNAEDCDVGPWDDSSFHTWTLEEARAVLGDDEWQVAQPYWDLFGRGELHSDPTRNVLFIATSIERLAQEFRLPTTEIVVRLEHARQKLAVAQRERPRPPIDKSIYACSAARLARSLLAFPDSREHALLTIDALVARDWAADLVALRDAAEAAGRAALALECTQKLQALAPYPAYWT